MSAIVITPPRKVVITYVPYAATPKAEVVAITREVIRAVNTWLYSQG